MHWEELQLFLSALSRAPGLLVSLSLASPVQVLDPAGATLDRAGSGNWWCEHSRGA